MIHKVALPALLVFLLLVVVAAVVSAILDRTTRVQSLSAIASSISAMVALLVALWTDLKDRRYREQALKETENKRLRSRKSLAALYSAEIRAWLNGKHVEDVIAGLRDIDKASLQAWIKLRVIAKQSAPSGAEGTDADSRSADIIEYVAQALRLDMFERISAIPGIWTTQFRRDDIDILDGNAPEYFVVMGTIWTNLNLKAQQLSGSVGSLRLIRKTEVDLMPVLVGAIADDAIEIREHLNEFLRAAKDCGTVLQDYPEKSLEVTLKVPVDLLVKSRDPSQRIPEALRLIAFARLQPLPAIVKKGEELVGELIDSVKKAKESMEGIAREAGKLETAG